MAAGGGFPEPRELLIVTADDACFETIADILVRSGFRVGRTDGGSSGWSRCVTLRPELVIIDNDIPGESGIAFCQRLKAAPETRDTPVLVVLGTVDPESVKQVFAAGGADFISRPVVAEELLERVSIQVELQTAKNKLATKPPGRARPLSEMQRLAETLEARPLRLLEAVLEAQGTGGIGTWIYQIREDRLFLSDQIYEFLGIPPGNPPSLDEFFDLVHPEDREKVKQSLANALLGEPFRVQHRVLRKDGGWLTVSSTGKVLYGETGRPQRMVGVVQDISQSKAAEDALRRALEFGLQVVSSANEGIIVLDPEMRFRVWNPFMEGLSGLTADRVLGRLPSELFPFLGAADVMDALQRAFLGQTVRLADVPLDFPLLGTSYRGRTIHSPLRDSSGQINGVLVLVQEIQLRKTEEDQARPSQGDMEKLILEAEAAKRDLESFSYAVSHDLRAPLRAITGFSEILAEDGGDRLGPEMRKALGVICAEAGRMGRMLEELLTFHRLGSKPLNKETTDMAALAKAAFDRITASGGYPEVELKVGEMPTVEVDPGFMLQVWNHLLGNAVKFSRKRRRIMIDVEGQANGVQAVFCVRDNGVGFDMRHKGKLFQIFQRLHSEREFEGDGVGLALVKRIVARHGGRVWAEGAVDQGAAFFFSIPAVSSS